MLVIGYLWFGFEEDFYGVAQKKMVRGGLSFLLGILEFLTCFVVVNRGELWWDAWQTWSANSHFSAVRK
jgi:hypothetical protein